MIFSANAANGFIKNLKEVYRMRLKDKVVVITGAGSGIGKETALLFAKEGAIVIVADINQEAGEKTVQDIKKLNGQTPHSADAISYRLDCTVRGQTSDLVKTVLEKFGRIDVLINNAGITQDARITKMTEKQWDSVMNVNLKGVFNCIQAVVDAMIAQHYGVIVNAASIVGIFGNFGQTNYAASKGGLIAMTKSLAKELGKEGIRVNAVAPGFILTPMTEKVPEKVLEMMKEKSALRMLGEPLDVANAYLYLASDDAKFITGEVLEINGGLVI